MISHAPGHIQGFIALRRDRARQRVTTALDYLALMATVVLLLFSTGTIQILLDPPAAPSTRVMVDLADCPPLIRPLEPDVVSFTIAMKGDGTPEVKRCTRLHGRMKYVPRAAQ